MMHNTTMTLGADQNRAELAGDRTIKRPSRLWLAVLLAGTAFLAIAGDAAAQLPPGASEPTRPREPLPALPSRGGEDYEPLGIRLGSFRMLPAIELGVMHNDNIFTSQTGKTSDQIYTVVPKLDVRSDWNNHALNLKALAEIGRYQKNDNNDYEDYEVGVDGRLDILRAVNVYGGLGHQRQHEDRGSVENTSGVEPTIYRLGTANAGYFHRFNRLSARLEGRIADFDYDDTKTASGTLTNQDRNRTEYRESLRVGYEIIQNYEAFVRGELNQREYDKTVDDSGFKRSSDGYSIVGGAKIELSRITDFEAFAGWMQQNYDDARFGENSGPTFGGLLNWSPAREWQLRGYLNRTIEETTNALYTGYTSTLVGAEARYQLFPNFRLRGIVEWVRNDYEKATGNAVERTDTSIELKADARYSLNRNFYVGPEYRYKNRESDAAGGDYSRNIVMLRLGAQY